MIEARGAARPPYFNQARCGQDGHPLKGDVLSVRCPPLLARGQRHEMSRHVTSCPQTSAPRRLKALMSARLQSIGSCSPNSSSFGRVGLRNYRCPRRRSLIPIGYSVSMIGRCLSIRETTCGAECR
jgi:hypothetical protein